MKTIKDTVLNNKMFCKYLKFSKTINFFELVTLLIIVTCCHPGLKEFNKTMDLSGTWKFQLDSTNAGINEKWFTNFLSDSVHLPGTTDENK